MLLDPILSSLAASNGGITANSTTICILGVIQIGPFNNNPCGKSFGNGIAYSWRYKQRTQQTGDSARCFSLHPDCDGEQICPISKIIHEDMLQRKENEKHTCLLKFQIPGNYNALSAPATSLFRSELRCSPVDYR